MIPTIRPAAPEDESFAFAMLSAAGHGMVAKYLGGGSETRARRIFRVLWSGQPNQFHWQNCCIAQEAGQPLGLLCSYPTHSGPQSGLNLPQLIRAGGWGLIGYYLRHPLLLWEALTLPEGHHGEYYIASVATAAEARGRGIGTTLIRHAMAAARNLGIQVVSLVVARDNPRARDLYTRLGFIEDPCPRHRHPLVTKMIAPLAPPADKGAPYDRT